MRLLCYGGRDFANRDLLWSRLDEIDLLFCIDLIIEGEATGADRLAQKWAEVRKCPWHPFPALWDDIHRPGARVRRSKTGKLYDADAGPRRNQQMIDEGYPDAALECPGGTGTADMHDRLVRAGITPMKLMEIQPWRPLLKSLERSGIA